MDYVIVDTAGRLHTKQNLMLELEKMKRTAQRIVPELRTKLCWSWTPHGQNACSRRGSSRNRPESRNCADQARRYAKAGLWWRFRGVGAAGAVRSVGEKIGDLLPFDPKEFVESLFA